METKVGPHVDCPRCYAEWMTNYDALLMRVDDCWVICDECGHHFWVHKVPSFLTFTKYVPEGEDQ